MATLVPMPKLSDTMEEGAVAQWLKKEGDQVEESEDIVEIETDKATMSYQAPASGVILKIFALPGKTLPLNAPLCVIGKPGEIYDELLNKSKEVSAKHATTPERAPKETSVKIDNKIVEAVKLEEKTADDRVKASPLAKKLASEKNLDLTSINGSGPNGRIVMRDLDQPQNKTKGSTVAPTSHSSEDKVVPVSLMRKTIAKRLLAGKNDAPHFYLTISVDMTRMKAWRTRLNADTEKTGVKVSVNDLVIQAVAKSLRKHPGVNSSWQGDSIIEYAHADICMAVALPTGLVTPVIRSADQLGIYDIAKTAKDLGSKAREGKLINEDYAGGTFTISNLGMLGVEEFTAIINPPQACILAVGATISVPAVNDKNQVVVQPRMKLTLSCDHRVVDGAMGAQFLQTLKNYLEDPLMMLT